MDSIHHSSTPSDVDLQRYARARQGAVTRKLPCLSLFQSEVVRCLRIVRPFDPNRRYSRFHHTEGSCRCPGDINNTALAKRPAIINAHFN